MIITKIVRHIATTVFKKEETLVNWNKECVSHKQQDGSYGMAQKYQSTCIKLVQYLSSISKSDIKMDEVNNEFIEGFAEYMKENNLTENTVHFYLRNFSAMYHRKNKDYADNPFKHVSMRSCPTRKRALDKQTMQRIKEFDSEGKESLAFARDMFMFSFYTQGMSFVDIAYLKADDIEDGTIMYKRHKTDQPINVTLVPEAKEIIRRYYNNNDKNKVNNNSEAEGEHNYIFGIIKSNDPDIAYKQYRSGLASQNRRLKKIGDKLGLDEPLTTYIARHTWATLAQNKGVPTAVISRSLGHTSETTTRIYLGSMDTRLLARYNRLTTRL